MSYNLGDVGCLKSENALYWPLYLHLCVLSIARCRLSLATSLPHGQWWRSPARRRQLVCYAPRFRRPLAHRKVPRLAGHTSRCCMRWRCDWLRHGHQGSAITRARCVAKSRWPNGIFPLSIAPRHFGPFEESGNIKRPVRSVEERLRLLPLHGVSFGQSTQEVFRVGLFGFLFPLSATSLRTLSQCARFKTFAYHGLLATPPLHAVRVDTTRYDIARHIYQLCSSSRISEPNGHHSRSCHLRRGAS